MSDRAAFTLADLDAEALGHAERAINHILKRRELETQVRFRRQSVQQLVKESRKHAAENNKSPEYDLVYCAGLFDYLPDNTCQLLMDIFYQMLAPGGLLVATNVDKHAARHEMECSWNGISWSATPARCAPSLRATPRWTTFRSKRDSTGVKYFWKCESL